MCRPDASLPEKSSRSVMDLVGAAPTPDPCTITFAASRPLVNVASMRLAPRMSPARDVAAGSLLCSFRDVVSGELWKARDVASGVPLKVRDVASPGACIVAAAAHDVIACKYEYLSISSTALSNHTAAHVHHKRLSQLPSQPSVCSIYQ
jgi:hypothetical protein